MSIAIMTKVWGCRVLGGNDLLLMLALADHANDDGVCWPSVGTIANKIRKSERQTRRLLSRLEKANIIRTEHRDGMTTLYVINVAALNVTPDIAMSGGGVTQLCQGGGDIAVSAEPSLTVNRTITAVSFPASPDDSGTRREVGAKAPGRPTRRQPERSEIERRMMDAFCHATGYTVPLDQRIANWWYKELREIPPMVGGDVGRAVQLINDTVAEMRNRKEPLWIKDPNSIIGIARNLAGAKKGIEL